MEVHAANKILQTIMVERDNVADLIQDMDLKEPDYGVPPPIQPLDEDSSHVVEEAQSEQTVPVYDAWYGLIEEHTLRVPICEGNRLDNMQEVAKSFSLLAPGDTYVAGIWRGDLIRGLLWHSWDFESTESTPRGAPFKLSGHLHRAPSWTWASLDGSIRFIPDHACDVSSDAPLVRNLRAHTLANSAMNQIFYNGPTTDADRFGSVSMRNGCISLSGQFRAFSGLRGFSEPFATWMRENRPRLGYDCTPDISIDPDFVFDCDKYVFPLMRKRCHPRCRHSTGCDKNGMAYGLIVHFVGQGNTYDEVPALRLARAETDGFVSRGIEVFMRCGMAAFYMSDFERVPWQDAVVV